MKFATKNLDKKAMKKRELIEQLYLIIQQESDKENAFFDVKVNNEKPKESKLIGNRPGVELFASELLMEMERFYDESYGVNQEDITEPLIYTGKWLRQRAKVQFSEIEIKDVNRYENSLLHNSARSFNEGFSSSIKLLFKLAVYALTLIGAFQVFMYLKS